MKKLFLFLILFIAGITANAQFTPYNNLNYVKLLKTPPNGLPKDSVLVYDSSDQFVKMRPTSTLVPEHNSLSGLQGGTADQRNHLDNAQVSLVNGSEQTTNKATDFTTVNNTLYPTVQATKTYTDGLVAGLLNDRGSYDASTNLYPSTGGSGTAGAIKKGNLWAISVAGSLGGVAVGIGDWVRALVDTPAQTSANWAVVEGNFGYVPENVANKTDSFTDNSSTKYVSGAGLVAGLATKQPTITGISNNTLPKSNGAGGFVNSNISDSGTLVTVNSKSKLVGNVSIGGSDPTANVIFDSNGANLTGSVNTIGYRIRPMISTSSTVSYTGIASQPLTANGFNIGNLFHFSPATVNLGIGTTVTNQYGFYIPNTFTTATNNYAFRSMIPASTNNWNLYMDGTAANHFAGNSLFGTTTNDNVNKVQVNGGAKVDLLDLSPTADTSTAATHYYVETATDGKVRPKTLENVKTEIVTTAAIDAAKPNIALSISPTFTGAPTAPTAPVGTNTTQIATTEFVLANSGGAPQDLQSVIDSGGYAEFDEGQNIIRLMQDNGEAGRQTGLYNASENDLGGQYYSSIRQNSEEIELVSGVSGTDSSDNKRGRFWINSGNPSIESSDDFGGSTNFTSLILGENNTTGDKVFRTPSGKIAGTYTLATTDQLRPYKVYTATLTQSGTDAPVATVLENTLSGTVVWTRNGNGNYTGTLNSVFTAGKTLVFVTSAYDTSIYSISCKSNSVNTLSLLTQSAGVSTDDLLEGQSTSIEVRVYN